MCSSDWEGPLPLLSSARILEGPLCRPGLWDRDPRPGNPGFSEGCFKSCGLVSAPAWTRLAFLTLSPQSLGEPPTPPSDQAHSQGCQAGSMRHRLSRLLAAATRVLTLLSPPSNWARLCRRVTMAVTAFCTRDTSYWLSMFSGCPAADSGDDVSSCVFLCEAMISSRSTVFRMPSTCGVRTEGSCLTAGPEGSVPARHSAAAAVGASVVRARATVTLVGTLQLDTRDDPGF